MKIWHHGPRATAEREQLGRGCGRGPLLMGKEFFIYFILVHFLYLYLNINNL